MLYLPVVSGTTLHYEGVKGYLCGAVSGVGAGIVMGLIFHFGANLVEPMCIEFLHSPPHPSLEVAWIVHLSSMTAIGVVFAGLLSTKFVKTKLRLFVDYLIAGIAFTAYLGVVAAGVLFPRMLEVGVIAPVVEGPFGGLFVGFIFAIGYLAYGLTLGATFATINGVTPRRIPGRLGVVG